MASLNPARIRLVDQCGDNLLFVGNLPIIQSNGRQGVSPESLFQGINRQLASGHPDIREQTCPLGKLPEQFDFVSFSLMESQGPEARFVDMESSFFDNHPEKGVFLHDDLCKLQNLGIATDAVGKLFEQYLISRVRRLIEESTAVPRVLYVHSASGIDRVGVLLYCYAMRYAGFTLRDATRLNERARVRQIDTVSLIAVEQYALYLRRFHGMSTIGDDT